MGGNKTHCNSAVGDGKSSLPINCEVVQLFSRCLFLSFSPRGWSHKQHSWLARDIRNMSQLYCPISQLVRQQRLIDIHPTYQQRMFFTEVAMFSTWSSLLAEPAEADQEHPAPSPQRPRARVDTVHQRPDSGGTDCLGGCGGSLGTFPNSSGLESKPHKKEVKKAGESRLVQAKGPVGSQGSSQQERLDERDGRCSNSCSCRRSRFRSRLVQVELREGPAEVDGGEGLAEEKAGCRLGHPCCHYLG